MNEEKSTPLYFKDEGDLSPGVSRIGDCIAEFFQRQAKRQKRHLKREPKRRKKENQRLLF